MTSVPNKIFSLEFKREAVRLALTSGRQRKEIAKDLGVDRSTLRRWIREEKDNLSLTYPNETPEQELARLRSENAELRLERDILKKATAFFARESH